MIVIFASESVPGFGFVGEYPLTTGAGYEKVIFWVLVNPAVPCDTAMLQLAPVPSGRVQTALEMVLVSTAVFGLQLEKEAPLVYRW